MQPTVFDIETIPDPDLIRRFMAPLEVKYGNTKDPVKRKVIEEEAKKKQVDGAALNPHISRVMSVHNGIMYKESPDNLVSYLLEELSDKAEIALLQKVWNFLAACDSWVTFNGAGFDVPFILRRSLILGVTPTVDIPMRKYDVIKGLSLCPHLDVRLVLAETMPGNGPAEFCKGTLDYYGNLLLDGRKKINPDIDHAEMWKLWTAGTPEGRAKIIECGEDDVLITAGLWRRIEGFYC